MNWFPILRGVREEFSVKRKIWAVCLHSILNSKGIQHIKMFFSGSKIGGLPTRLLRPVHRLKRPSPALLVSIWYSWTQYPHRSGTITQQLKKIRENLIISAIIFFLKEPHNYPPGNHSNHFNKSGWEVFFKMGNSSNFLKAKFTQKGRNVVQESYLVTWSQVITVHGFAYFIIFGKIGKVRNGGKRWPPEINLGYVMLKQVNRCFLLSYQKRNRDNWLIPWLVFSLILNSMKPHKSFETGLGINESIAHHLNVHGLLHRGHFLAHQGLFLCDKARTNLRCTSGGITAYTK